jgi:hypothetical protein
MAKPVLLPTSSLVPLAQETRLYLPTPEAALHLCRASQTLRMWAHSAYTGAWALVVAHR